jgi:hypothetical protein
MLKTADGRESKLVISRIHFVAHFAAPWTLPPREAAPLATPKLRPCTHQEYHASVFIADHTIPHSISQTAISKLLFRSGECKDATRHTEFYVPTMSQRRKHMDIYGQCQGSISFFPTYSQTCFALSRFSCVGWGMHTEFITVWERKVKRTGRQAKIEWQHYNAS